MSKSDKPKLTSVFLNGIITENPTIRLVLGTCPTIATTTSVINAVGMGAAASFVLIGSNFVYRCSGISFPTRCAYLAS